MSSGQLKMVATNWPEPEGTMRGIGAEMLLDELLATSALERLSQSGRPTAN